ncbi:Na+/H+ antiporter subunit A [Tomitella biformata]|uniref:Na+/H+ antiporter subunit A n=1 Tax=Tomitella biformata TaxID=630403 RepID=UPI0004671532|nr:Na+/H+ antiporter subunit A [Tomitella biformata]
MITILGAHALAAALAPLLVRWLGRNAFYLLALVPLGGLVWAITDWDSGARIDRAWVPELSMNFSFRYDSLAQVLVVLVLGVGALVLVYCARYFKDTEPRLGLFAAQLTAFAGAMFGLVLSDNMLLLYVFWEITTVLSFLLVGHYAERATSRDSATKALLVTTAGGLAMLVGIIALGQRSGTYLLSELVADPPTGLLANVAVVLLLIGALSKSAIVPFHFWLPGAMAAPTPVSAYLHAAAMVKAGIFLVARLAPGFADAPTWRPTVITLGLLTLILAGWRALREHDLKLILAFGTVSQLGFMMVLIGMGTRDAALAGLAIVVAHALFKSALFMIVGAVDHTTGTRDIRELAGLGRKSPVMAIIAVAAAASMAGAPPFLGFVGKEAAFAAMEDSPVLAWVVLGGLVVGSTFTVAYTLRVLSGAFAGKGVPPSPAVVSMHKPGVLLLLAPGTLAALGLVAGLMPGTMDRLLVPYADTVGPASDHPGYLSLWHGFSLPLWLTVLVFAAGIALFFAHGRVTKAHLRNPPLGNADRVYAWALRSADRISLRMTTSTQRGSLPLTQGTILVTLVLLPSVTLLVLGRPQLDLKLWDVPWQFAIGLLMVVPALAATVLRNRLAAVLMIGFTGYGMAMIFALHGAPDLALTQFLVETLLLVVFVLVLRKLPPEAAPRVETHRALATFRSMRVAVSVLVGTMIALLGAYAINARTAAPISALLPEAAYDRGGGKNVVNVLLVDIRAWDTLGEVSVLLVAATGVASLVFRHRRFGAALRVADAPDELYRKDTRVTRLRGSGLTDTMARSLVLEMTTRLVFPTVMVLSLYFFFTGHNHPGGGFAGGLTAGLALTLRYLAGGRYEIGEALPVDAGKLLGVGLLFCTGTAVGSLLLGAPVLSSAILEVTLPLLGEIKLVTALFFDVGVYLIVVGVVLDILRSLGARLDSKTEVKLQ